MHTGTNIDVLYDTSGESAPVLHLCADGGAACGKPISRQVRFSDRYSHVIDLMCTECQRHSAA